MNDIIIRLPKGLKSNPQADAIRSYLLDSRVPVYPDGKKMLSEMPFTTNLRKTLNGMNLSGRLIRGLDQSEKFLESEARGMAESDRKTGQVRGARISRLILTSNDGSYRFCRNIEKLLNKHEIRLWVIRFTDADAATLGQAIYGKGSFARLIMVTHREAVEKCLTTLVTPEPEK